MRIMTPRAVVLALITLLSLPVLAQVGIGTTTPSPNAVLELKSPGNNQGFLVPRLTTAERTAAAFTNSLATDDKGLLVFDTNDNKFYYWSGSAWIVIEDSVGTGTVTTINTGTGLTGGPISVTGTISIADGGVTTLKLADGSVTSVKIVDASIVTADLADGSVTSAKVVDGTLTNADISASASIAISKLGGGTNGQVLLTSGTTPVWSNMPPPSGTAGGDLTGSYPNPTITNNAITSTKISDGAIATADLADGSITTAKILDATIGTADIADASVTTIKVVDGTLTNADINASAAIAVSKVAAGTNGQVLLTTVGVPTWSAMPGPTGTAGGNLTGTYPNPTVANDAITSAKILDATIGTSDLADGSVTTSKVLDGTLATTDLADGSITTAKILDATIATADLADASITSAKVVDGTLTNADINSSAAIAVSKVAPGSNGQVLLTTAGVATWSAMPGPGGTAGGDLTGTYPNPTLATSAGNNVVTAINSATTTGTINTNRLNTAVVLDTESPGGTSDISGSFSGGLQINVNAVTNAEIFDGTINTADLADNAVTNIKIAGVAPAKINQAGATNGDVLKWNGTAWTPLSEGDGSSTNELQPLDDVLARGNDAKTQAAVNFSAISVNMTATPGALNVDGSHYRSFTELPAGQETYDVKDNDYIIIGRSTTAKPYDVILPKASSSRGRILIIRSTGNGTSDGVRVSSSDGIDGAGSTSIMFTEANNIYTITVFCDGKTWYTISKSRY